MKLIRSLLFWVGLIGLLGFFLILGLDAFYGIKVGVGIAFVVALMVIIPKFLWDLGVIKES